MADLVYPPVIGACRVMFRALGMHLHVEGGHNVPRSGGAVMASNHVSYLDFIFAGFTARDSRRLVRFMAKESVFTHTISGPLMRGMHHIPVDRSAGAASFRAAVAALKAGEVVGIFPEASTSRSFTVKEFKTGAVRMAAAAKVPLLPTAVWGGQRMWTKGLPKDLTGRGRTVAMAVGEPITAEPGERHDDVNARLQGAVTEMLTSLQERFTDQPAPGEDPFWIPAHLGGTAPTPEQAAELDARNPF